MNSLEFIDGDSGPTPGASVPTGDSTSHQANTPVAYQAPPAQERRAEPTRAAPLPQFKRIIQQKIGLMSQMGLQEIKEVSTVHEKSCSNSKILPSGMQSRVMNGSFLRASLGEGLRPAKEAWTVGVSSEAETETGGERLAKPSGAGKSGAKNIFFETESNENEVDWEEDTFFCKSRRPRGLSGRLREANYVSPKYRGGRPEPRPDGITFTLKSPGLLASADAQTEAPPGLQSSSRSSRRHVFQKFNSFSKSVSNDAAKSGLDKQRRSNQGAIRVFKAEVVSSRKETSTQTPLQGFLHSIDIRARAPTAELTGNPPKAPATPAKTLPAKPRSQAKARTRSRKGARLLQSAAKSLAKSRNFRSLSKVANAARPNYSQTQGPLRTTVQRRRAGKGSFQNLNYSAQKREQSPFWPPLTESKLLPRAGDSWTQSSSFFARPHRTRAKFCSRERQGAELSSEKNAFISLGPESQTSAAKSTPGKARRESRGRQRKPALSVYGQAPKHEFGAGKAQAKPGVACSTLDRWGQCMTQSKMHSTRPQFGKLKQLVSANLRSIESVFLKGSGLSRAKNFSQAQVTRLGRPRAKPQAANKENAARNGQRSRKKASRERAQAKPSVHRILTRCRNKSLKSFAKSNYKARILSREKYIHQRVSQMLKLNKQ